MRPPMGPFVAVHAAGNSGPADFGLGELSKQVNCAGVVNRVNEVNR